MKAGNKKYDSVEAKAREIVGMLQGTMGLEGQALSELELDKMVRKTMEELWEQKRKGDS